jgi:hypothetical protein
MLVLAVLGLASCGGTPSTDESPPGPSGTPTETEGAETGPGSEAAERERRSAVEDASRRLSGLRQDVAGVRAEAEPVWSSLDESLRGAVEGLERRVEDAERALSRLEAAGTDDWERARSETTTALDDLREHVDRISADLEGQKRVLRARNEDERKPVVGLFEGLDGGEYDAYLVSVVRDVQRALRERDYYDGPADGYLGKPTMEALARFQEDQSLARSGVPTPETRRRLLGS